MIARVLAASLVVSLTVAACGASETDATADWAVDCVAITGKLQSTALSPLERVPVTGLPRDKLVGELTDAQIRDFCDFDVCLGDSGYNNVCVLAGKESFRLESDPIFENGAITCYPQPRPYFGAFSTYESRQECVRFYHEYFSRCHVGLLEDCIREISAAPITSLGYLPSCDAKDDECG